MASRVDALVERYERHVRLPWERGIAGPQRVWFAVYRKEDERRLRYRVDAFRLATEKAGKAWAIEDLTNAFAEWMDTQEYREAFFRTPATLAPMLPEFEAHVAERLNARAQTQADDDVLAVLGIGSLFGFAKVSDVIPKVASAIRGRVLVFFPGSVAGNNYRLLDARDGWNYLAVPITAFDDGSAT
jgi:hypothetical protein